MSHETFSIVRAAEWSTDFEGNEFRLLVMDTCPNCRVFEAHAIQVRNAAYVDCHACTTRVAIEQEEGPRIPRVGEYIGFAGAHPNNLYEVLEADEKGVFIDFIGNYRAVELKDVRFHRPCNSPYCVACSPRTYGRV